ncbi:MAG TPA: oligopeptide transporter, OPT family, partial [candidate division Zixibacteria bacterium]|nr:oligopeptide transporter, OPT family [candidate division Zixibacteria bacterium]
MANTTGPTQTSHSQAAFQPYVPASQTIAEVTLKAVVLGAILSVVFGVANAYLALKYGLTVSASIPAAVMSMAILRGLFKKVTVLENNIVQTIGSAGESLAAGIAFTIPVFFIWAAQPRLAGELAALGYEGGVTSMEIFLYSMLGGILGILLMIPLRRYLVQKEHETLAFPEGTACAEIIIAGEEGGSKAKNVFLGIGVGAAYKLLMNGVRLWPESLEYHFKKYLKGGVLSIEATPALFGVGYILGPRVAGYMLSGAVLGYLAIGPFLSFVGAFLPEGTVIPPATINDPPLGAMNADELRAFYIRYLGIGGVSVGGFIALLRAAPTIFHSFGAGFRAFFGKGADESNVPRTDQDMSMKWVLGGALAVMIVLAFLPGINVSIVAAASAVVFGFLFIVVAARIVGEIGSTNSPVSGMTIATLLVTAFILMSTGASGVTGMIATITVGSVVCIAVCLSGDIAQDLKTGFLLGATPKKQQLTEFIGLLAPALVMGFTVYMLGEAFGYVASPEHADPLEAPQANAMATIVEAAFGSGLPWPPIIAGGIMALGIELLGVRSLPVAIGMYLPLSLSTPIFAGGL